MWLFPFCVGLFSSSKDVLFSSSTDKTYIRLVNNTVDWFIRWGTANPSRAPEFGYGYLVTSGFHIVLVFSVCFVLMLFVLVLCPVHNVVSVSHNWLSLRFSLTALHTKTNVFVEFRRHILLQIIGIPMGTSCVTRLVDHVLSSYDAECIPLYLINEYWWTFYQMWTYLDNGWDNRFL